ncbi:MAG: class A beta-lactamase [Beijerinckiaceae bacterium]|nr:class A beta-lactamase [Beijerinckiaceae bacterium]
MVPLSRRLLLLSAASLAGGAARAQTGAAQPPLAERFAALERRHGGRLGIAVLDTASGGVIAQRGGERFAMCSTHKMLSAAFALWRVDHGQESLSRRIVYSAGDLVTYSPATERHAGKGMSVAQICEAAIMLSDNTAANLLFASFGGPASLTGFVRALGDDVTCSDRIEPDLNEAAPGDPRDTTTPLAMAATMQKLLVGEALSQTSRAQLTQWLIDNKTGDERLRAGLPKDWRIGDKTGTGEANTTNDVAILWPPGRAPLIVTVFYAEANADLAQRNAIIADCARAIAAAG